MATKQAKGAAETVIEAVFGQNQHAGIIEQLAAQMEAERRKKALLKRMRAFGEEYLRLQYAEGMESFGNNEKVECKGSDYIRETRKAFGEAEERIFSAYIDVGDIFNHLLNAVQGYQNAIRSGYNAFETLFLADYIFRKEGKLPPAFEGKMVEPEKWEAIYYEVIMWNVGQYHLLRAAVEILSEAFSPSVPLVRTFLAPEIIREMLGEVQRIIASVREARGLPPVTLKGFDDMAVSEAVKAPIRRELKALDLLGTPCSYVLNDVSLVMRVAEAHAKELSKRGK